MEKRKLLQYGSVLVVAGILIGLLISANLNFTRHSHAVQPSEQTTVSSPQTESDITTLENLSTAFANVADRVNPSVVTIFTETIIKQRRSPSFQFPFEEFFGEDFQRFFQNPQRPQREQKQFGLGSGVIVSSDGIIITNNHVVEGADNIKIRLVDDKEYDAEIKGMDNRTDLAILKIKATDLPFIKFGDSDRARVGEWVLAIGSPLSPELAHTVTSGIISAKGRSGIFDNGQYEDFIQTDAAINPGNSGGALVNLKGELIGINAAIASRTGGFMGIGFAIPSNLVNKVMTDILEKGRVVRGWLGVGIQDVNPELATALKLKSPTGALVTSVQEKSPADAAGIKAEDVIIRFNDKPIKNSRELSTVVAAAGPDARIKLVVLRDGKEKEISVKLEERAEEDQPLAQTQTQPKALEKVGILVANLTPEMVQKYELQVEKGGVVIVNVETGSISAQSGLRPGDVILRINRKDAKNVADYNKIMESIKAGDTLLMHLQRGDGKFFTAFTLPEK